MNNITVNINGRDCTVAAGSTILHACRDNGVDIPTLCHDERLNPFGSCNICRVEVQGAKGTMLACGTTVTDGMVIRTDTEAVRKARQACVELLLSQHFGDCKAPCTIACPAHVDIQGYVGHIANGRFEEALQLIKAHNPLPIVCGRICTRPCEAACRRNLFEGPVGIAHLKRFAADLDAGKETPWLPETQPATGKRVAIIGAGPAGLSAAWYLSIAGHSVTLFERHSKPGGMLRYGIPAYRLPREALDREVEIICSLGAKIVYNQNFGSDVTLESLKAEGFDAVLLAVGSQVGKPLGVPGEAGCPGVYVGVDFLGDCTRGTQPDLRGKRVVVVGGGNTAMDCARSSLRLGARSVDLVYRRTRNEMPADAVEVHEAEEEGVRYRFLTNPKSVRNENGHPVLTLIRMELGEPDASGRRSPKEVPGSEFDFEADVVIGALGQDQDLSFVGEGCAVSVNRNKLAADETTGVTNLPGVFAAGDAVTGPKTAILAIAGGHTSALAIDQYLRGQEIVPAPADYNHTKAAEWKDLDPALLGAVEAKPQEPMPMIDLPSRKTCFAEVETGITAEQALREAARCLSCGCKDVNECKLRAYATQYGAKQDAFAGKLTVHPLDDSHPFIARDINKCIMCGRCVRICGELVGKGVLGYVSRGYGVTVQPAFSKPFGEDKSCINCGQCVSSCPVGALTEKVALTQPGPYDETVTDTVCTFCGAGCSLQLRFNGDTLLRTTAQQEVGLNAGSLCKRGRFGNGFLNDKTLLKTPLVRKNGQLLPATLDEALAAVAAGFVGNAAVYASGRSSCRQIETLAGIAAARNTGLRSFGVSPVTAAFYRLHADKLLAGYAEIAKADLIITLGFDLDADGTVPGMYLRTAIRGGTPHLAAEALTDEVRAAAAKAAHPLFVLGTAPCPKQLGELAQLPCKLLLPAPVPNARALAEYLDVNADPYAPADSLLIWGEDPVGFGSEEAAQQIADARFTVVCDIKLTATAAMANVVLPMPTFAQCEGSFVNAFGVEQPLHRAMAGDGELTVLAALAAALGSKPAARSTVTALPAYTHTVAFGADVLKL